MSNSAVESSWKSSSFSRAVSHEYPALATEGLWRKQAHNNWERFVTTGVKWMKPRDCQVMQFMGKRGKKKWEEKNIPKPSSVPTQEHSSFTVTFQECADRHKAFCVTLCQWTGMTVLAALFLTAGHHLLEAAQPVPPLPHQCGLRGEWCTIPLKAIQDLKKPKSVFRAHIKTSRCLN